MDERLGDAPIEEAYQDLMTSIAHILDNAFNHGTRGSNRKTGFVLMVFPFNENEGRCNYISNGANREDVVLLMKEQIKRFEGQPEDS